MRSLDKCNPYAQLVFYLCVLFYTLTYRDPLSLGVSALGALVYALMTAGGRATLRTLFFSLTLGVLMVVVNALVNPRGVTILFEIGSVGVTAESVIYGAVAAATIAAAALWFVSFNKVFTGEKYIYTMGRLLPSLSLLVSMTLRLIPELNAQYAEIRSSVKSMGLYGKGIVGKIRGEAAVISMTLSRALEGGAVRADSMRARGYGLRHRSCYVKYKVRGADIGVVIICAAASAALVLASVKGALAVVFYPEFAVESGGAYGIVALAAGAILAALPAVFGIVEVTVWKLSVSKITR